MRAIRFRVVRARKQARVRRMEGRARVASENLMETRPLRLTWEVEGIGRMKTEELKRYGDPTKRAAMQAIKTALDPNGIMNPGVILG